MTTFAQSVSRRPGRSLVIAGGGAVAAFLTAALAVLWRPKS
jgi:hypothetical protein